MLLLNFLPYFGAVIVKITKEYNVLKTFCFYSIVQDLEAIIGEKSSGKEIWKLFANLSIVTMINVFQPFSAVFVVSSV